MVRFILLLALSSLLFACNSNTNSDTAEASESQTETPSTTETTASNPPAGEPTLPSVPLETLQELWEKCDYVDYVFYYTNFSMSQDKQSSIRTTLRQISDEPAVLNPNCKAIGRLFYQVEGENALEGDLYLSNQCAYFVFYKDGKQTYANKLTAEGLQFYQNIFNQIQQNSQGQ